MSLDSSNVTVWQTKPHYSDASVIIDTVAKSLAALNLPADFVHQGDNVVLKPNWVKEHDERFPGPNQWEHVVTHPSVIEGVIRWAAPQLQEPNSDSATSSAQRTDLLTGARLSASCQGKV